MRIGSELSYVISPYLFKRRDENNRCRCICLNFPVSRKLNCGHLCSRRVRGLQIVDYRKSQRAVLLDQRNCSKQGRNLMGIVPVYVWNHLLSADNRDGLVARSEQPVLPEEMEKRKMQSGCKSRSRTLGKTRQTGSHLQGCLLPSEPALHRISTLICEFFKLPAPISMDVWTPSTMGTSRANRYRA